MLSRSGYAQRGAVDSSPRRSASNEIPSPGTMASRDDSVTNSRNSAILLRVDTRPALFQDPGTAPMNMHRTAKSPWLFACISAAACGLSAAESNAGEPDKGDKQAAVSMVGKKDRRSASRQRRR